MKRYWLFAGDTYYPRGGFRDLRGEYDTLEAAVEAAQNGESMIVETGYDWWHVFDSETQDVVESGGGNIFDRVGGA